MDQGDEAIAEAKEAEERVEAAFLALSADKQVELVHAVWVVNAIPEPIRAKKALVSALLPRDEANLVPEDHDVVMDWEVLPKTNLKEI